MIHLYELLLRNNTLRLKKLSHAVAVSFLILMVGLSLLLAGCDTVVHLIVENRLSTDLTIIHEGIKKDGSYSKPQILGTVPSGQNERLKGFILSPSAIGYTVILKAEDPSGKIVWQESWLYEEFKELEDGGWRIIIEPQ